MLNRHKAAAALQTHFRIPLTEKDLRGATPPFYVERFSQIVQQRWIHFAGGTTWPDPRSKPAVYHSTEKSDDP